MHRYIILITSIAFFVNSDAQQNWTLPDNPVELGQVNWLRNYDEAVKASDASGLPIFLLFQEVPGCSNCTKYGQDVLSHPFIVEMIETYFIPLAIFNNVGGHDRVILKKFGEPTWNNPVVRIINQEGQDLVPRLSGDFSQSGLSRKIKAALQLSGQIEPDYFSIFREELSAASYEEEAYLSMYCFWTGEKEISKIPGIISTEAGYMHGKEVVKVAYNTAVTSLDKIVTKAREQNCADQVYGMNEQYPDLIDKRPGRYRTDREVKYYLHKSGYRSIPMTGLQAAKVNALLGDRKNPDHLLSPRQTELKEESHDNRNYINKDFVQSWYDAISIMQ